MRACCRVASLLLLLAVAVALLACGGRRREGLEELPLDGNRRLDRRVVPLHYELDLTIYPQTMNFAGRAAITVRLAYPSSRIVLHGEGMSFASVYVEQEGRAFDATVESGPNGALAVHLAQPLHEGEAKLRFVWDAPLSEQPSGLYRVRERGRWYAFTQFEPLEARRAFPSFDQPEFKTPFEVTLRVPRGMDAYSNAPRIEFRKETVSDVHVFAETKPIPTYLVAFAVGNLDRTRVAAREAPPIQILTTRDKRGLTGFAATHTPLLLDWLSEYFGQPYPYAKLDLVAVPNFGAGAMENVGLVTFRERLLLLDEDRAPARDRYASRSVIAHELAHMWYGNLVTMKWWDELWLNESFATWMATRALSDVAPELEADLDAVLRTQYVMGLDSRRHARAVRQPIETGGDVYNAFDGITYGKGAAVLRMLESWIGEEAFRGGVRAYMEKHAHGSGGTQELMTALSTSSGKPVGVVSRLFLDQPGVPLVDVELLCDSGPGGAASLELSQTRFFPRDAEVTPELLGEPWSIPVCVAFGLAPSDGLPQQGAGRGRQCFLLEGASRRVALDPIAGCPSWIHPNADERGYYRWRLPPNAIVALAGEHRRSLSASERVALPGNAGALLESGALPIDLYLEVLTQLALDPQRQVTEGVARAARSLRDAAIPEPASAEAAAFADYAQELLSPHLAGIGPEPAPGEPVDAQLLRSAIVPVLADVGRDEALRAHAAAVAARYVASSRSVSEESLADFLPIAAWEGDAALWQELIADVRRARTPAIRQSLVASLGSFEDPQLLRQSLDAVVDGNLRAQDYRTLVGSLRPAARDAAWDWLTRHHGEIALLLGPHGASQLPRVASGMCSMHEHDRVAGFFSKLEAAPEGTQRNADLVLEDIQRCAGLRKQTRAPLAKWLHSRAGLDPDPSASSAEGPGLESIPAPAREFTSPWRGPEEAGAEEPPSSASEGAGQGEPASEDGK